MRIAFDCRKIGDYGIGSHIRGLLDALTRIDFDHTIVALVGSDDRRRVPDDPRFEIEEVAIPLYGPFEPWQLGRAVKATSAELVHVPHYVVPVTRVPIVVTIHDLIHLHLRHRNPLKPLYARRMIGRAIRTSRTIVTVSEAVAREISALDAQAGRKLRVVPNGIDRHFFAPRDEAAIDATVRRLGIERERYFLFVGNDKPHKNVGRLVEAFRSLREDDHALRLVLAGGSFERYRDEAGVIVTGFVDDDELRRLVDAACALVMPSLHEGFGLPAAEAMARGTAVITSNDAALVEVTGDAALHVDAESVEALRDAMTRLAGDPQCRADLGRIGREQATRFDWSEAAATLLRIWEETAFRRT